MAATRIRIDGEALDQLRELIASGGGTGVDTYSVLVTMYPTIGQASFQVNDADRTEPMGERVGMVRA